MAAFTYPWNVLKVIKYTDKHSYLFMRLPNMSDQISIEIENH